VVRSFYVILKNLISKDALTSSKVTELSFHQRILKKAFTKIIIFSIENNNKCFLSSKSAY